MRRIAAPIALVFLAVLGLAAPARAGVVSGDATGIDFTAGAGQTNNVTLSLVGAGPGTVTFRIADTFGVPTNASTDCTATAAHVDCTMSDTASFSVILGDQDDSLSTGTLGTSGLVPVVVAGGLGNDVIQGTNNIDTISGDDGSDVIDALGLGDAVAGGAGDDQLVETVAGAGDAYGGGAGIDQVSYASRNSTFDMILTLDGVANDGDPDAFGGLPENDSLGSDIEQVVGGDGDDTITGNAASNVLSGRGGVDSLTGGDGDDSLDGGTGVDTFDGGIGNDLLLARDSTIDMAFTCGDGSDTAELDDADPAPGADCETVNRTTPPPPPPPPPGPPAPPPAPPPPPPAELPPPVLNESVNLAPVTGTVTVRLPGTSKLVPLSKPINVPVGTVVDTKRGSVTLISAADRTGRTQSGTFRSGVFRITQNPGGAGLVEVRLNGGTFRGCPRVPSGGAGVSARPRRKLFADVRGRYRSVGRYSSATVRGTRWLIEDGCDFTRVKVTQGSVTVRDFVKRKSITVRRGQTYTTRPRAKR